MNDLQKILGTVFPPYKFNVLRQEQGKLLNAIIDTLPDNFKEIKSQTKSGKLFGLNDWELFPDFKFTTISYSGETISKYKKRGKNFKINGLQIFSTKNKRFENIEILVRDNLLIGLKITNSNYQLNEFNTLEIIADNVTRTAFSFPKNKLDIFYQGLDDEIKDKLNENDLFDIDFEGRIFYAFHDLEDGNYLAVDKNQKVFSLVHDTKPMIENIKFTFKDILTEISENRFGIKEHLESRYKNRK